MFFLQRWGQRDRPWEKEKGKQKEESKGGMIVHPAVIVCIIVHVFFSFQYAVLIGSHYFALDIITSSTFDPPSRRTRLFVGEGDPGDRADCHHF